MLYILMSDRHLKCKVFIDYIYYKLNYNTEVL